MGNATSVFLAVKGVNNSFNGVSLQPCARTYRLQTRILISQPSFAFAQAPCADAVRAARAVVQELPAAQGTSIGMLARCRESSAEHDVHRLSAKLSLALPLEIRMIPVTLQEEIPVLPLSTWARFFMKKNLWFTLSGLDAPDPLRSQAQWSLFWQRYKSVHPQHEVFSKTPEQLANTCAVLLHGDEGRTLKKAQIMIVSAHSALGRGSNVESTTHKEEFAKQNLNYAGHTWSSRWLLCAMPKKTYDEERAANFQLVLDALTKDMEDLLSNGVPATDGTMHYFACIHVLGDAPFLTKAFNFNRSFSNVAKFPTSVQPAKGICPACLAGRDEYPFEDFVSAEPRWRRTVNQEPAYDTPSPLMRLPRDAANPISIAGQDLFHGFHLGIGKTFMASSLALLSYEFEGRSQDARFEAMAADFFGWCASNSQHPYIRKLSRETINWMSTSDFPAGSWAKGSTTTCLLRWFVHACRQRSATIAADSILRVCFKAALNINLFLSKLYKQQVWIESRLALEIAAHGFKFLQYYGECAKRSFEEGYALFIYMPNLHRLHHIFFDMRDEARRCSHVFSPLVLSCQVEEDYIGRPSRVSRRVSIRTVMLRVLQRSLEASYGYYVESGWLLLDS